MDWSATFQAIPLLGKLPELDLKQLSDKAKQYEFEREDVIIQEGEQGDRLFIVIDGQVKIYTGYGEKYQKHIQTFGPKSYFGEMSLIDRQNRSATVVADTYVQVVCIEREDFQNQIRKNPELALELLESMSLRVRAMNKLILGALGEIAPICIRCNKVREPDNRWVTVEQYIKDYSDIEVPHSMCPDCSQENYPKFYKQG